jgi:hypothetical protein
MATEIRVPKIGASVTKASIGRWFKRIGDPVSLNEPLVEIETDGATIEVPASATGVLSDVLFRDGVCCWERLQSTGVAPKPLAHADRIGRLIFV